MRGLVGSTQSLDQLYCLSASLNSIVLSFTSPLGIISVLSRLDVVTSLPSLPNVTTVNPRSFLMPFAARQKYFCFASSACCVDGGERAKKERAEELSVPLACGSACFPEEERRFLLGWPCLGFLALGWDEEEELAVLLRAPELGTEFWRSVSVSVSVSEWVSEWVSVCVFVCLCVCVCVCACVSMCSFKLCSSVCCGVG